MLCWYSVFRIGLLYNRELNDFGSRIGASLTCVCVYICIDSAWAVMEIVCDVLSSGLCNAEQWSASAVPSLTPPSPLLHYARCHTGTASRFVQFQTQMGLFCL